MNDMIGSDKSSEISVLLSFPKGLPLPVQNPYATQHLADHQKQDVVTRNHDQPDIELVYVRLHGVSKHDCSRKSAIIGLCWHAMKLSQRDLSQWRRTKGT
jgi:hypothetical protein